MWIYAQRGFVSIVQHRDDPHTLLARGRFHGDIQALFAMAVVEETPAADYRFRARLSRSYVATRLREITEEIDYPNFKASLPLEDLGRRASYHAVWDVMATAQDRAAVRDSRAQLDMFGGRPSRRMRAERVRKRKKKRGPPARLRGGLQ